MTNSGAMKRLMVVMLMFSSVLASPQAVPASSTGPQNIDDTFRLSAQRLNASLVAIVALGNRGPLPVGTGFFIDKQGTFLTAAHVLEAQPGILSFRGYVPSAAGIHFFHIEVISLDQERDFAVCHLIADENSEPLPRVEPLRLVKTASPPPGTLVAVAGFPLGSTRPVFQFGTVASFAQAGEQLQIGLMLNDGDSGGPVMDVRSGVILGMVVSVRTAGLYERARAGLGQQNAGLSWVLPVEAVLQSLPPTATTGN